MNIDAICCANTHVHASACGVVWRGAQDVAAREVAEWGVGAMAANPDEDIPTTDETRRCGRAPATALSAAGTTPRSCKPSKLLSPLAIHIHGGLSTPHMPSRHAEQTHVGS